jgi:hypothetical protein
MVGVSSEPGPLLPKKLEKLFCSNLTFLSIATTLSLIVYSNIEVCLHLALSKIRSIVEVHTKIQN